ncbi:hypothetical protein TREMEDRAFT_63096 [Tremella mesenterica DSM 1558]|uniref:uncharacterized protein n=1 Tax=Tremella mesenterica (strain ATCC 24925 / CBS 8224 / DSM 1558 / NBRC 9311 / NRRL Y-6157 / RJB 2259-6 / UBC 559-6) TaxID=578456 RepID=UPI0003F4913B|nr:uncharacterized protein TREMEDRAFT_63096 [Tremella mesenterica DSM 1558]EIW68629.1 hypothetical protein TREMEDRAFT_63096 [Tremella mesenterica DSM 1558]
MPSSLKSRILSPETAEAYSRQMILNTFQRMGLETVEAGVMGEIARLVERHIQKLYKSTLSYSKLSSRRPNMYDLHAAWSDTYQRDLKDVRKSAKKRRRRIPLEPLPIEPETMEHAPHYTLNEEDEEDRRPDWVPEGVPDLPPRYTWAHIHADSCTLFLLFVLETSVNWLVLLVLSFRLWLSLPSSQLPYKYKRQTEITDSEPPPSVLPQPQVTSASLDFVKLISAESADIPPELGVVDYRKAQRGKRKQWGTKGVGI